MFRKKKQTTDASTSAHHVDDLLVRHAFEREWLSLALSHLERPKLFPPPERHEISVATATGVVHTHLAYDSVLRADLKLWREPADGESIAHFGVQRINDPERPYLQLTAHVQDPSGEITTALADAFLHANASRHRFVYVHFRKEKTDASPYLAQIRDRGFATHQTIQSVEVQTQDLLDLAPEWSWRWNVQI